MKERGILFSAPMVRALLDGTKTQTRRAIKPQPANDPAKHHPIAPYLTSTGSWNWVLAATGHGVGDPFPCPCGVPGNRLWVREAWRCGKIADQFPPSELDPHVVWYEADGEPPAATNGKLRPGMFMPRWASRLTLEVTGVRVERLQSISEADAMAEGARCADEVTGREVLFTSASKAGSFRLHYRDIWTQINGDGSWDANPWVWVISFRRS